MASDLFSSSSSTSQSSFSSSSSTLQYTALSFLSLQQSVSESGPDVGDVGRGVDYANKRSYADVRGPKALFQDMSLRVLILLILLIIEKRVKTCKDDCVSVKRRLLNQVELTESANCNEGAWF